jgi:DNA-binding transcriptional regulator YdaS (Cro superfamily)
MREIEAWAALLCQNRAWARLLDVHDPVAAQLLRNAARRALAAGSDDATAVDRAFRSELGKVQLAPSRPGPQRDRLADYQADRVVLAYRWLTGEAPPAGDPYDAARPVADSALYRLGAAAFRAHGVPWRASRILAAIRRLRLS